ncbi:MAG: D-alanyl-D-alanine carboxypeptidase family protein [Eubacteriales bacterium]
MKKCLSLLLSAVFCWWAFSAFSAPVSAQPGFTVDAVSAVLMEQETGTVLFEQNAAEALPPASVTKIMTLLLVMEAIDAGKVALTDNVSISENAASMGGSQVYLEAGELFTVEELIKCAVIASANDASVALAEFVSGSEEAFVEEMNARAAALGMTSTHFENVTGLDDTTTNHVTSAMDIAVMSRLLIAHPLILQYSCIWMDSIRDGAFILTNTNRLVRFYEGANGLKTGSTAKAKFCISATAERDGMTLIAVIMASPSRDIRNNEARKLLDWGFANYALYRDEGGELGEIRVLGGLQDRCQVGFDGFCALVKKSEKNTVTKLVNLPEYAAAPIKKGEQVGTITYRIGEQTIGIADIQSSEAVEKISFWQLFGRMLQSFLHPSY